MNLPNKMAHARQNRHDGRTQYTLNRQLTVPPLAHSRPVLFNQSNRQFVIIQRVRRSPCRNPHPTQYHKYRTAQGFPIKSDQFVTLFPHLTQALFPKCQKVVCATAIKTAAFMPCLVYFQQVNSPNRTMPISSQADHTVCCRIYETRGSGRKSVALHCDIPST